jgi:hypothetical protein
MKSRYVKSVASGIPGRSSAHAALARALWLGTLLSVLSACGGGGGGSSGSPPPMTTAPSDLSYPTPPAFTVDTAITPLTPTVVGDVTSYSVSPALPAGLSLNTSTGVISGTPTNAAVQANYTVKATNAGGSTTATVSIVVMAAAPGAPSGLNYPTPPAFVVNTAITPLTPTVTGTVTSYSVSPALPAGLSLNASSGVISGTPTSAVPRASYTVEASNAAGSTTATVSIVVTTATPGAPSDLMYPTPPAFIVNTKITPLTPTVVGTVTSYTVSPALPAGLSLNTGSGVISGTPTSAASQANYTVKASNSAGSTTAFVSIVVNGQPPSIGYSSPYYGFTVNIPVQNFAPTVNAGTVTSWSISPALPAGLEFDSTNGTISGTPTTAAAAASYTVTANNSGGQATVNLTLAIAAAPVLNLGHASQITLMRYSGSSVMSLDQSGVWLLQAYGSGTTLASGTAYCPQPAGCPAYPPIDLAGNTAIYAVPAGVEVRSAVSGQVLATISGKFSWFQLADDGSYITTGSTTGLTAWSPSGNAIATQTGDYSMASVFSAPGQIQVALGAAGQNVIQTISVSNGTSVVSPIFQGTFASWFLDGASFFSILENTTWIYSSAATQEAALVSPGALTGRGHFYWTSDLRFYEVGGNGYAIFSAHGTQGHVVPSGSTIGILDVSANNNDLEVIDLSGAVPTISSPYSTPIGGPNAYAAVSASSWLIGNQQGIVFDGASLAGPWRYLTPGYATSIAAGTAYFAVGTASGQLFYFDASTDAMLGTIGSGSGQLAMSADGTVLAVGLEPFVYLDPSGLPVYSLPSATLLNNLGGFSGTVLSFSSSGTVPAGNSLGCSGGAITVASRILCEGGLISPGGSTVAVSSGRPTAGTATDIYNNGTLTTAVPGWAVGWLDSGRLLVEQFALLPPPPSIPGGTTVLYTGGAIFSPSGTNLGSSPIPPLQNPQVLAGDSIYSPQTNTITSVTSGSTLWASADAFCILSLNSPGCSATNAGAASGSQVIFALGNFVLAQPY